ncbi:PREDICTED: peptidyl-prolyl cis-trans isomerase FKBP15-3-like [Camelina sativa]|uniref:peptidylprolyl isomerase n=1 Tax=Camelina sativa TaxID=90675 RepID=A0ABM0TB46_CAMSA|nr:PREDICTED: peptidyl-prolyl cis-trans isomerase FKBP15-3-like [Camelina sativa]
MGDPNGKKAGPGNWVFVHVTASLKENGKVFCSTDGEPPAKIRLGHRHVIEGVDVGVNGMRVGGKRKLTIPPAMGFGAEGLGDMIPPDAWVVYDVELISVNE